MDAVKLQSYTAERQHHPAVGRVTAAALASGYAAA